MIWQVTEESCVLILVTLTVGFLVWTGCRERALVVWAMHPETESLLSWSSHKVSLELVGRFQITLPPTMSSPPMIRSNGICDSGKTLLPGKTENSNFSKWWTLFLQEAHTHLDYICSITAPTSLSPPNTDLVPPTLSSPRDLETWTPGLQVKKAVDSKSRQLPGIKPMLPN